ncbi:hypothetical protein HOD38_05355 [archaeon]|jgi:hypothetical protein|nr:hypothetical protein [archaeon]MBT4397667.1 hypothetical protein [archaeon]MBT4441637.1 hypothetical protein [archaeon]
MEPGPSIFLEITDERETYTREYYLSRDLEIGGHAYGIHIDSPHVSNVHGKIFLRGGHVIYQGNPRCETYLGRLGGFTTIGTNPVQLGVRDVLQVRFSGKVVLSITVKGFKQMRKAV